MDRTIVSYGSNICGVFVKIEMIVAFEKFSGFISRVCLPRVSKETNREYVYRYM